MAKAAGNSYSLDLQPPRPPPTLPSWGGLGGSAPGLRCPSSESSGTSSPPPLPPAYVLLLESSGTSSGHNYPVTSVAGRLSSSYRGSRRGYAFFFANACNFLRPGILTELCGLEVAVLEDSRM
jgi:hypothetical protein